MKLKGLILLLGLLTIACIKAPDDNMDLGDETTPDNVQKALDDAQGNATADQLFHVGDTGIKNNYETAFTSTQIYASNRWTVTSSDATNYYIECVDLKNANAQAGTTYYKYARTSPPPKTSPNLNLNVNINPSQETVSAIIKRRLVALLAKISIRPSTAVGDVTKPKGVLLLNTVAKDAADTATHRYFGLKTLQHVFTTVAYKANTTHIEYNDLQTQDGETKQIHYVLEISKEVPGLFTVLSYCGSWVELKGNVQIPVLVCQNVDDFKTGTGTN